jgi:ribosome assembly protein RRB1
MSGSGKAHIWDVSTPLKTLAEHASPAPNFAAQPAHTMDLHKGEGFALDWSGLDAGRLATGDIKGSIFRLNPKP